MELEVLEYLRGVNSSIPVAPQAENDTNMKSSLDNVTLQTQHQQQQQQLPYDMLRATVNDVVIPIICLIGIVGNAFNFYIFYCRWYQKFMNNAEKSAVVGLMSLALSDTMFCLTMMPALFLNAPFTAFAMKPKWQTLSVLSLYYRTYKPFFANLFILNSTWLIACVSVQRIVAVTWTRQRFCITEPRKTALVHGGIFLLSFLVCFPLLMRFSVVKGSCFEDRVCYYILPLEVLGGTLFLIAYRIVFATLGIVLPLALLAFSNVRLILILCRSRYSECLGSVEKRDRTQITLLAVALVVSFLVLVTPSMIADFLIWVVKPYPADPTQYPRNPSVVEGYRFLLAVTLTNLLQAIKFSFNFLLYSAVNRQFRLELRACKVKESCRANKADQEVNFRLNGKL